MKEHKMSRRNFLKVGAVASAAGLMTAAPVAANAAAPAASTAADEENCFGLFQKKPKYIFLFIGDGMGTAPSSLPASIRALSPTTVPSPRQS